MAIFFEKDQNGNYDFKLNNNNIDTSTSKKVSYIQLQTCTNKGGVYDNFYNVENFSSEKIGNTLVSDSQQMTNTQENANLVKRAINLSLQNNTKLIKEDSIAYDIKVNKNNDNIEYEVIFNDV